MKLRSPFVAIGNESGCLAEQCVVFCLLALVIGVFWQVRCLPCSGGAGALVAISTNLIEQITIQTSIRSNLRTQYQQFLAVEKGLTSGSCHNSDLSLDKLEKFASKLNKQLVTLSAEDIEAFKLELQNLGYGARTIQGIVNHLRGFYAWLRSTDRIDYNPTAFSKPVNVCRRLPRSVPEKQLAEVLDAAERAANDPLGTDIVLRNSAISELLYGSGIRNSELVTLREADLDVTSRRAIVYGKEENLEACRSPGERRARWSVT